MRTSLAFVDDHPILLDGLVRLFGEIDEFEIVGQGNSADDAVTLALQRKPDVLVLDINMPGNAFDAISRISFAHPDTKVVAFTASIGIDVAVRALEAGASGYVIKGSTVAELACGIRTVMSGETFITQSFASKVVTAMRNASLQKVGAQAVRLSVREDQIVRLLLRGKKNKEIASHLDISEKTVKHYMTILMHKLNARNRIEVVLAAQRLDRGASARDPLQMN